MAMVQTETRMVTTILSTSQRCPPTRQTMTLRSDGRTPDIQMILDLEVEEHTTHTQHPTPYGQSLLFSEPLAICRIFVHIRNTSTHPIKIIVPKKLLYVGRDKPEETGRELSEETLKEPLLRHNVMLLNKREE